MAKDGSFFKLVRDVHPVFRVPTKAIVLQCLIAVSMVLSGTFDQILRCMRFCLGIFPVLAVIGVFKLRNADASVFRMPAYPLTLLFFVGVSALILVLAYFERPVESSVAVATAGRGIPFYFGFARLRRGNRRQGHHT